MNNYSKLGSFRSRGRLIKEPNNRFRTPFQRDRDRIIHSASFRRLKHKTQVFVNTEGDHYRTRITHSIEVAQIARSIAKYLNVNDDLAETLSLAHDLGHTPFGHAGEIALNECMSKYGGFDHNLQTLRIVMFLEHKYLKFKGLNLSIETLDGLIKHNGPYHEISKLNKIIGKKNFKGKLNFNKNTSIEAQISAISDDIAYNNHDIDDGFRAKKFKIKDICEIELIDTIYQDIIEEYTSLDDFMIIQELVRRLIGFMVNDLLVQTNKNLGILKPQSVEDIRCHDYPIAAFSNKMKKQDKELRKFLHERVYSHSSMDSDRNNGRKIIKELFDKLLTNNDLLPLKIKQDCDDQNLSKKAIIVCDFIASMTDRSATANHAKVIEQKNL